MIVKNNIYPPPYRMQRPLLWRSIAAALGILLIALGVKYINWGASPAAMQESVYCGAEDIVLQGNKTMFISKGVLFDNAVSRSAEEARSGQYSSKLDSTQTYGMLYLLEGAKAGDRYKATVWRYGSKLELSYLTVSIIENGELSFYKQEGTPVAVDKNEWEQLELNFEVPVTYQGGPIKIYVFGGNQPVYFDDLYIERVPKGTSITSSLAADSLIPHLNIRIDEKGMRKLEVRRRKAINTGIYFAQDDDWVKGKLRDQSEEISIKLRFKGDWMDHLAGKKWSFRIKVKEPNAWNRLMTFSIQRPETRDFLSEWVYHQWLGREDVLSTRYDFLNVSLNGEEKGIYAFEEHFEKQLLEFRGRREGPIVKFSEDGVWNARKRWMDMERGAVEIEETLNSYEAAIVLPFQESKTLANPQLAAQFKLAHSLMTQYKFGLKWVSEVFDIERLAKYYAITDLCQGYHSMVWHNQRFYYNPILSKLEPIGYDGFTADGIYRMNGKPFMGAEIEGTSGDFGDDLVMRPFLDQQFVARYLFYLNKFSQKTYVEHFWMDIAAALTIRMKLIQKEYPSYNYEVKGLLDQAARIQSLMYPLNDNSLRVFTQSTQADKSLLHISNYHILPIEVIGFGIGKTEMSDSLNENIWLSAHDRRALPTYEAIELPSTANYLFFRMPGTDSLYHSRISPWPKAIPQVPAQQLLANITLSSNELYRVEANQVYFPKGQHQLDQDIVIPAAYEVHIAAGAELDFIKGAKFISYSPISMYGTEEEVIRIYSSDQSAQGFSVLQADKPSVLHYVSFEHLNTLNDKGWNLTGAVNFYESEVQIDHCSFSYNHCEDALNLIRSPFKLSNSVISHTLADGLDVDFCQGEIRNTRCFKTGNDGMDFSGSQVSIYHTQVNQVGDKGISVGEESQVKIHDVTIQAARVGIASKDLSKLHIDQIHLIDCNIGFSAYQKKPEYGGASIRVDAYQAERVKHLHLIEQGSSLLLKGKRVDGI